MIRSFDDHLIREVESLDGIWHLTTAKEWQGDGLPDTFSRRMLVPGCWESLPGLESYRGKAWLKREFQVDLEGLATRLVFGGVSHTGTVYVDGSRVGSHDDAFTPWEVILPELEEGSHELIVEVDNSFGDHSALHIPNDYYTYGGITRPVEKHLVEPLYIDKVFATPVRDEAGWALDLRLRLRNCSQTAGRVKAIVNLLDMLYHLEEVEVPARDTHEVALRLDGLEVDTWSPDCPVLYTLAVMLVDEHEHPLDDLLDRIGFREIRVDGDKLLLNGDELALQGFNRHEDHPQFGCAVPVEAMAQDLMLMRDMNANFVRTCHYPNDQRFLDLCDELGILVWEESHARHVDFNHPAFERQIEQSTSEMVTWHFNHPSIIIWGCLNECDSVSEEGVEVHRRVLAMLKELDGSRPTTFASNQQQADRALGLVDIVAWNLYPGWYGGAVADVADRLETLLAWLDSPASRGAAGKPLLISEFGAGAIYGNRQRCRSKWSEEYQSEVLDETLRVYTGHPRISGTAIWQFCDVRVTEEEWFSKRPRTMNNKGIVDEYRRPKLASDVVRRRFGAGAGD